MKTLENTIKINEVDCYIGNSCITKYATNNSVQHQILVNDIPLGRLNGVADSDRDSRVVLEKEVNNDFVNLFNECLDLKSKMKSEHCNSMEEYKVASDFNKPLKEDLKGLVRKMWNIESLDLDFEDYLYVLNY